MYELKTNTACRIAVGPLVDPGDFKTAEVALTVTDLAVQLYQIKNDGSAVVRTAFTPTASGGSNDMALVASSTDGVYDLELTAAQLNFLGNARLCLYDVDGFLVHSIDLQVVSANYFDHKYGSSNLNAAVKAIDNGMITAAVVATGAIDSDALATDAAQEIADALLDRTAGVETGYTVRQAMRLILAALAGKLSGAGGTTVTIRDVLDSKNRIVASTDLNGNRTSITLDAS